jgi:flagellar biosynthesis protein FlhG
MSDPYNDQAAGLRKMVHTKPVRVIAVTSGKGGVGKTNVSVNLGVSLSKMGKEVMLLDADLGLANIDVLLGLRPTMNLSHVMEGQCNLEEIILDGPAGLKVIPAASGVQKMAELSPMENAGIIRAFSDLNARMDVLIVDTAAGIADSVISFAKASQEVVVVVCDEPASITDAYALIKLMSQEHGQQRFRVLSNMVRSVQEGRNLFAKISRVTDQYLDVTLDFMGMIPFDEKVRKAVQKQKSVVDIFPDCSASQAFVNVARKVQSWPMPTRAEGHLEFFVERLIEYSAVEGM